jgi:hypothetical protein
VGSIADTDTVILAIPDASPATGQLTPEVQLDTYVPSVRIVASANNTQGDFQMDHLRDCIIGVRPEMLPIGECFGNCACECHEIFAKVFETIDK